MLTPDEIKYLTKFIMTRPLDGLNLFDAQKLLEIMSKLQPVVKEEQDGD